MSAQWTQLTFKLNNGREIPAVGLGTWKSKPDDARNAVKTALLTGYRHIDTAQAYRNEAAVGEGIKLAGVPRESIFLSTKINNMNHKRVAESMDESLKKLQTDYVDLALMHWPVSFDPAEERPTVLKDWNFTNTWREMEKLVEAGKALAIGVANFGIRNLETLLASANVVPAVCLLELNPHCPSAKLVDFCQNKGLHVMAYTPLGSLNSPMTEDETVRSIADAHGRTVQQVLLVWGLKRGTSVVPISTADSRIRSNFDLDGVDLTDEEMGSFSSLPARFKVWKTWWSKNVFSSDEEGRDFYDGDRLFEQKK
ncbi:hypothetical protein QFC22_005007 [Naganishia vaughanmartiniae]|uniref:Uncharacterized protein n=1 Tax=Naganishia vaughanmartiniae TaxID=1424756 RepID=A0ACC2WX12_9TREE|nr:hypothetical protein QFC22_005007 [Naganishia vaughanmartiniae]